ncbi:D-alanyl-D-alanine carboxypeptidase family protein [Homoserinibacter sp. GY 40078]|uniref:D-alanyl-D-alanine carboxypeptidase family protein n=1 Tax=Homoserinibacter sp. GY 40078 TaxID=2603275 RepID=UPI0011C8F588|nr:D-alanyl-D-alanine carboxypeptidase [Homoserinibacter sp. GY 40078]TXK17620.1 D-alanyl-D-alanine carboxypeptidase [Homoserinibacter sp. GY 40078]
MPLTRRQIYRRRRIVFFGGLTAVLAGIAYLPLTLFAPVEAIVPEVQAPQVATADAADIGLPSYGASAIAAVGFDGLLARTGSEKPLPMASITKIITALTVLSAKPIDDGSDGPKVTMTSEDAAIYRQYDARGASVAPVAAGEVYTERELLEIMLIDSAGNYAVSVSNWAFGSQDAFVKAAAAWLEENGLSSITVVEPTGLDPANTATADDLVALGELAHADPVISKIVATAKIDIHDVGEVVNSNKLLGMAGVDGIKTGTLNAFGANLLFSADLEVGSETVELVGVVLGAVDHDTLDSDVIDLLADAQAGFHEIPLVAAGDPVADYETVWGEEAQAVAADDAWIVVWGDTPVTVDAEVDDIRLTEAGTSVGTLEFTAGNRTVTVDLELSEAVEDPGPWWRLGHPEIIFGLG